MGRKSRAVLAVVNPDGTETTVTAAADGTIVTFMVPFDVSHDRFRVSGEVRVPVRLVEVKP